MPDDAASCAWDLHFRDPDAALPAVRTVLATPHAHDGATLAWAELTEGYHRLHAASDPAGARTQFQSAGQRFVVLGDARGALLADTGRARVLLATGEPLVARAMLTTLLPEAKRVLGPHDLFWVLNTLSGTYFYADQLDEAIRCLYEALETLRQAPSSPHLPTVLSNLAAALVTVGDHAPARELAQEAVALLEGYRNPRARVYARANLAEALAGTGAWREALDTVEALFAEAAGQPAPLQNHYCAIGAEVYAHHGRRDDARRCAQLAADIARTAQGPYNETHARWAAACAARLDEDPAALLDALHAAGEAADRARHLPIACRAYAALSDLHAAREDYASAWRAQRRLLDAMQQRMINRASARYYLLRVEHELARLREERDRELALRRESEALAGRLAEVNAELEQRMREIEALQARLAAEAVRDPLTGLFNRRYLDAVVPGLVAAADRQRTPLTMALIDLDRFKCVNDAHGHLAGDKVLRRIGKVFASALRPSDVVARWGGEEFCVVFPATDTDGAQRALATLAARLRALAVDWGDATIDGLSFSAAVAEYGVHGRSFADLVGAADAALYAAKDAGRDRVLVAPARA